MTAVNASTASQAGPDYSYLISIFSVAYCSHVEIANLFSEAQVTARGGVGGA